jgi:hypothetical protein
MKAKVTKVTEQPSRMGGIFYYVFLKTADGKSVKTCIFPKFGNARRWMPLIEKARKLKDGEELWLDGLNMKGSLVDADSPVVVSHV